MEAEVTKRALPFLLILVLTIAVLWLPTAQVSAVTYEVGLRVGNWAQFSVLGGFDTSDPAIPMPQIVKDARNTQWINVTVQGVTTRTVTLKRVTQFANNTQKTATITGNVETGTGNLNFTVVARYLGLGDYIIANSTSLKILKVESQSYANALREVNYSNSTETIQGGASSREYHFVWDRVTGIMLDSLFVEEDRTAVGGALSTIEIKMQKTNMWEHGTDDPVNPIPPGVIDALLIAGAVIAAAALAGYAVLRKPKPRKTRMRR